MENGWLKLWRKSLKSEVWQNPKLWHFWCYCLMRANYKKNMAMVGYQKIELEPGQFIFGRKQASEDTGLSERSIRTCIDYLKKSQKVTIKTTNKFSIITIRNWDKYQPDEIPKRPAKRPTNDQQTTTDKNVKKNSSLDNTFLPGAKAPFQKEVYGEFKNVRLTSKEYEKLIDRFGGHDAKQRIENLGEYIASKGKKYKSHYATILNWARRDKKSAGLAKKQRERKAIMEFDHD